MGFFSFYPPSGGSNPSVGINGNTAPTSATEVAGINPSGNLQPLQTDATGRLLTSPSTLSDPSHVIVDSSALPTGASTSANQVTAQTTLDSIDSKLTSPLAVSGPLTDTELRATPVNVLGPLTDTELRATPVPVSGIVTTNGLTDTELRASAVPVSLASIPLATGAATSANQVTAQASLSSIDSKLTSPLAVTGPLTDTELRATPVPVSGTISTGGLTDTELRASAVPVSVSGVATSANQVTAQTSLSSIDSKLTSPLAVTTGGLTDTELRATPVPISGSVTTSGTSTVSGTVTANAGTNLNTSLLALDSTVAKDSSLATIDTSINSLLKPASTLAAVTTVGAVTSITNALPAGNNIIGQIKLSGKTIANSPVRNDYTVTAVTTGAYTQLVASTTTATTEIEIFDSSGQTLFLAIGAAASEVNQILIFPGGNGRIPLVIPAGTRISIKAVSGNASVGEIDINFYN